MGNTKICTWNEIPKNLIDGYLKKNELMKEAWEKAGWKLNY